MPVTLSDGGLMPLSYSPSPFLFTPGRRVLCKSSEQESTSTAAVPDCEAAPPSALATPSPTKRTVAGHPALRHRTRPASVSSSVSSTPPSSGYSSGATSPLSSSLPSSPCGSARGSVASSDAGDASWWREQELRAERSSLAHKVIGVTAMEPLELLLCIIVESEADVAAFASFVDSGAAAAPAAPAAAAAAPKAAAAAPSPPIQPVSPTFAAPVSAPAPLASPPPAFGGRVAATPFAKKLAAQQGIDLAAVPGSGPGGRVLASDLANAAPKAAAAAAPAAGGAAAAAAAAAGGEWTDIQLTNMRRTIAKRLTESKSTIPHYYLSSEITIDKLLEVRERLNGLLSKGPAGQAGATKLSINDFIVKASALACLRVPEANSFFMDTFISYVFISYQTLV
ncbi:dlat-1 [Pristionchus pacificus]|uniref:Dlat-1 n=1 Tax=Pristionchus pacificus TaxID=54126 RepID=A0A2A6C5V5_PRIPA|nr:dlat-1 [Pristionchus pacificus]|eukprot:PDM73565.1 dlat-1 [Pristionchus pacificus]